MKRIKKNKYSPQQLIFICLILILSAGYIGFKSNDQVSASYTCDLFASTTGNDSNNGSLGSPYLTPQKLFNSLSAGQVGCLRGGTYTITGLSITHGGSQASPIVLTSYPGEQAALVDSAPGGATHNFIYASSAASYVVIDDINIDGGGQSIKLEATHITIKNSDITNHRVGQSCFLLGGASGAADNDTITNNVIHGCGSNTNQDHCIYDHNGTGTVIQYNIIYDCQAYAIQLYPDAENGLIDHNTTDGGATTTRGGIIFGGETAPVTSNTTVSNNIITYAPGGGLTSYWGGPTGTGNVASNNCLWNAANNGTGYTSTNNTTADPLFIDRTNHNYNLQAGSPCASYGALPSSGPVPGDLNSDGHVTVIDLSILLSHYGGAGTPSTGDCNSDNIVNVIDLSILLSHYGT